MITNNEIDIVKRNLKNKADSTFDEIWMLKINRRYRNHFTMNNGKKINGNIEYVILEFFNDDDNTIKSYLEDPTLVSLPDGFKINDIKNVDKFVNALINTLTDDSEEGYYFKKIDKIDEVYFSDSD